MDIMRENTYRQPEQYVDGSGILRNKWEDATAEDLFAVKERMYHQSRRKEETFDGKQWAAVFKGNGLAMVSKINMELHQNQYNVLFDYSKMRDFLKREFDIDTPLPRHEKIEYPYEEHNEAFERANIIGINGKPGIDPESLGQDYDPNDPKHQDEISVAIAAAEKLLKETNLEEAAATQRANRLRSDMEEVDKLIDLDMQFEDVCKNLDIDPHSYALYQYDKRPGPEAVTFEEAISVIKSFDRNLLPSKEKNKSEDIEHDAGLDNGEVAPLNDGISVGESESSSRPLVEAVNESVNDKNSDTPTSPSEVTPVSKSATDSSVKREVERPSSENKINQYLDQIKKQEQQQQQSKAEGNKSTAQTQDREQERRGNTLGGANFSFNMPFVPRIGSITSGIVSYPTKKFRDYQDVAGLKSRISESKLELLRGIKEVGDNFDSYSDTEKLSAVKRLQESTEHYQDDVKAAVDYASQKNDTRLTSFLRDENKSSGEKIGRMIDENLGKHPELEQLVKHMKGLMDMVKNLLRAVQRVFNRNNGSAPSPSM